MAHALANTHGRLAVGIVAATALIIGCSAEVKRFDAAPRHICAGEQVQLDWEVVGSARMTVSPPAAGLADGPVDAKGHATIAPATSTRVQLHVTRPLGKATTSEQEIRVVAGSAKTEVLTASLGDRNANPGCADGKVWATVHAQRFSPDVRVDRVTSHAHDDRTYDVGHEGIHARVAPGATSDAFAGTRLVGDWKLTAELPPGATCEAAGRNVVIDVVTKCSVEGEQ